MNFTYQVLGKDSELLASALAEATVAVAFKVEEQRNSWNSEGRLASSRRTVSGFEDCRTAGRCMSFGC